MRALSAVAAALVASCGSAASADGRAAAPVPLESFDEWAARVGRTYASEAERAERAAVFARNRAVVERHAASAPNSTYTLGLTQFADLTVEEFRARYLAGAGTPPAAALRLRSDGSRAPPHSAAAAPPALPSEVDWEKKGLVSAVKTVQCSALADELSGAIESAAAITLSLPLKDLDESQLSDCSGCGCEGCLTSTMCDWATKSGVTYSFDGSCDFRPDLYVRGCSAVEPESEAALEEALSASGPVVVAVEADSQVFMLYAGGVLADESCGAAVNHVLLAVGYGTDGGMGYFRARNSWGEAWGEAGYIRLARGPKASGGRAGECGILTAPVFPVVAKA